jgi:serine/threonine protein kinase
MEQTGLDIPLTHPSPGISTPHKSLSPASPLALFAQLMNPENNMTVGENRYIRVCQIGSGVGSEIFKVLDDEGNFYAIKRVRLEMGERDITENYQNEIDLLQELQDRDRIVNLVDYQITDDEILIVLELGDADLAQVIRKQSALSPNYIRYTWQQMLEAVQTIHDRKIIHGDLKPSNFLLVKGTLKLIDFGIAKVIRGDATSTEFDAQQVATSSFRYKAPENVVWLPSGRGGRPIKLGRSADVWSLGCILYELVYGRSPFPMDPSRFRAAVTNPQYKIEFPRRHGFHDFDCLVDVMEKCLQRKAMKRPSIEDLLGHQYIQQPSSFFVETRISIAENLKQFAQQIQNEYIDSDFESPQGAKLISRLARDLVCGRTMRIGTTR